MPWGSNHTTIQFQFLDFRKSIICTKNVFLAFQVSLKGQSAKFNHNLINSFID